MKKTILLITLTFGMIAGYANNLVISNVTKVDNNTLTCDVSWDNSWQVSGYMDGAYFFVKYRDASGRWYHLNLITGTQSSSVDGEIPPSTLNNKGIILFGSPSIGTQTATITFKFDGTLLGALPDFKVFGIEMVYVNQGAFYVGDGSSSSVRRYYQGNDSNLPYYIQSENTITYGTNATDINGGYLYQDIPSTFPKGYNAFWMMKYEITQEQYVEFLNTLTFDQQQSRTATDLNAMGTTPTYVMSNTSTVFWRNGIKSDGTPYANEIHTFYCDLNANNTSNEPTDGQNIACNYLSINDMLAYMDWAGMRPMTDLEFEKACRGTAYPLINETAMGSNVFPETVTGYNNSGANNEDVVNIPNAGGIANINMNTTVKGPLRVGCFAGATTNRLQSGATYYGAMNMQGNLYELVVDATKNNFTNTLGDGVLNVVGNNTLWSGVITDMTYKANNLTDTNLKSIAKNSSSEANLDIRSNFGNIRGVISW